jgi:putative DNA primase/helicase
MSLQSEPRACKELLHPGYHDTGNAQRFIMLFGQDFLWCPGFKKWLHWDGKRWFRASTEPLKYATAAMTAFYKAATKYEDENAQSFARASLNVRRLQALLEASKPDLVVNVNDLDSDQYLLNCANGTLDLRSLRLYDYKRSDRITKLVHVNYLEDAPHPNWDRFLEQILPNTEVRDFLHKAFGYTLTGDVSEKAIFIFFGDGNNGKTTFLEAVRFVLREYSAQVSIDTLSIHKHRENNVSLADLADVRGARFVTTSESEKEFALAHQKLKYLTGMGEIKACRKYENPTTFSPTFKLFMDVNHKPKAEWDDPAFWNRVRLIPFNVIVQPNEIDPDLGAKLRRESEGILAWMVEGCAWWQETRPLGTVPEIDRAGQEWRQDEDQLKAFLDENCIVSPDVSCPVGPLRELYLRWAQGAGESPVPNIDFGKRLESLGFTRKRSKSHGKQMWVWIGLGVTG